MADKNESSRATDQSVSEVVFGTVINDLENLNLAVNATSQEIAKQVSKSGNVDSAISQIVDLFSQTPDLYKLRIEQLNKLKDD